MTRRAFLALVLVAVGILGGRASAVPSCEEDQVLTGVGDFERGRWSAYECGPAVSDFAGGWWTL